MSEQNNNSVDINGGSVTGLSDLTATQATIGGGDLNITGRIKLNGQQGTSGQYLGSNAGSDPTWKSLPAAAVIIPAGSRMLFQQTAAPTGWVKQTSYNNRALRVVSGTVGTGGTVAFTTAFKPFTVSISGNTGNKAAGGTVANHTLSNARIPSHTHTYTSTGNANSGAYYKGNSNLGAKTFNSGASGGSQAHNHGFTGSNHNHSFSGSSGAVNVDVQYVDVIIATKS